MIPVCCQHRTQTRPVMISRSPVNLDYGVRTENYPEEQPTTQQKKICRPSTLPLFCTKGTSRLEMTRSDSHSSNKLPDRCSRRAFRDLHAQQARNEVEIDGKWRVEAPGNPSEPITTAVTEFRDFLRKAMEVQPSATIAHKITATTGCPSTPQKSEAFDLKITNSGIDVCGFDARGANARAAFSGSKNEDDGMHPFSQIGAGNAGDGAIAARITSAPFYSRTELDVPVDQYTPGLLARMSRSGFNAIWVWGDLEDVGHSDIYPELDQGVVERQAKLRSLVERASRYGMDVYLQLANRPMPESFSPGIPMFEAARCSGTAA